MRMRTCCGCGHAFVPRHAQVFRCETCEPTGRDQKDPTTRAQRDGTGDYERNRAIVLAPGAVTGQPPTCVYCGAPATTVDHVVAVANGGTHELSNLVPACSPCNSSKAARPGPAPVAPAHAYRLPEVHEQLGSMRLA
jgi:5-methylcytosine-specific restriction endonuclease McrA